MNANAMTPNWAIENGTPVDLAMTPVAAAVPGPQTTNAAVPTNSAATLREKDASALDAIVCPDSRPRPGGCGSQLLTRTVRRDIVLLDRTMFRSSLRRGRRRCQ